MTSRTAPTAARRSGGSSARYAAGVLAVLFMGAWVIGADDHYGRAKKLYPSPNRRSLSRFSQLCQRKTGSCRVVPELNCESPAGWYQLVELVIRKTDDVPLT